MSKKDEEGFNTVIEAFKKGIEGDYSGFEGREAEEAIAEFLAFLTVDKELTKEFWLSGSVDQATIEELLLAYFSEPQKRIAGIKKYAQNPFGQDFGEMLKEWKLTPDKFGSLSGSDREFILAHWSAKRRG
jgi:hypothetical protein